MIERTTLDRLRATPGSLPAKLVTRPDERKLMGVTAKLAGTREPAADRVVHRAMTFDPVGLAAEVPTAADFEREVLGVLAKSVGYEAAFTALRGATATSVGLDPANVARALRPGTRYERELAPVTAAALSARGVAVDTEVLGLTAARASAYFRHFAAPVGALTA